MVSLSHSASNDNLPSASGIYKITCTANKRFYIGSSINLHRRKDRHFNELRQNMHCNRHLQRAWNKYGEQAFIFEVLELVLPMSLTAREQYWLNKLKPFGNKGFNLALDSTAPMLGRKQTAEQIKKTLELHTGSKRSEATRQRMREAQLGKKASEATRLKLSESHKGQVGWNKGKTIPESVRQKISKTLTGRKNPKSEEARLHSSESRKGKPHPIKKKPNPYGPFRKLCTKCKSVKSIDDFYIRDPKTMTRRSHCKQCLNEKAEAKVLGGKVQCQ